MRKIGGTCSAKGCGQPYFSSGLCRFHYQRRRNGIPFYQPKMEMTSQPPVCTVPGCNDYTRAKGLCIFHYQRKRNGIPFDVSYQYNWTSNRGWICDGYRYQSVNGQNVREQRLVMEKVLSRRLLSSECVHHIDGNKLNNDPANLIVLSRGQHSALHNRERSL